MQNSIINGLFVVVAWHHEKIIDMKKIDHHHEILLFTGTTLAGKQFANSEQIRNGRKCSAAEELEMACWNGMLYEMFPEIMGEAYPKNEKFIWHVLTGKNFLYVSIGPFPCVAEHDSSIDPYFFMMNVCEN